MKTGSVSPERLNGMSPEEIRKKSELGGPPVDETLPPLKRAQVCATSEIVFHRLYFVRHLLSLVVGMGYKDCCEHVLSLLEGCTFDSDTNIRQGIAESIPNLAEFVKSQDKKEGDKTIAEKLVPIMVILLKDKEESVRDTAAASCVQVTNILGKTHIESVILPILLTLGNDESSEESRNTAPKIFNKIAPLLGKECLVKCYCPLAEKFAEDILFSVRRSFITNLEGIVKEIGSEESISRFLTIYINLTNDEIWSVRKACAQVLPIFAQLALKYDSKKVAVSYDTKTVDTLVATLNTLVNDSCRWVRETAYKVLGPLIALFPVNSVPAELVKHYKSLADEASNLGADGELSLICAYNFPAIVDRVGMSGWPDVAPLYQKLAKDLHWRVRETLAHSMHIVAHIVGQKITEEILLPIFEQFLKEDLEEVRYGALKHLALMLLEISPQKRVNFVSPIESLQNSPVNWRFRKLLSKQIGHLGKAFSGVMIKETPVVSSVILPLVYALMMDPVAAVRRAILNQVVMLSENLPVDLRQNFLESLHAKLGSSESFHGRILYAKICGEWANYLNSKAKIEGVISADIFEKYIVTPTTKLSKDKVPNVRIASAATLFALSKLGGPFKSQLVPTTLNILLKDKDKDVVSAATGNLGNVKV